MCYIRSHSHTSVMNINPPSVASSLPPSYRSAPPETASIRTAQEQIYQWSTSIPSGAPTGSNAGTATEIDTVVGGSDGPTKPFVYYTVFTGDGAIPSKYPVDRQDPFLGRVEARRITPPHTVASVMRCICNVEGVARHHFVQLLLTASSAGPMDRKEHIAILTGSGPGSDPQQPLALVVVDEYSKVIIAKWDWNEVKAQWLNFKMGDVLYTDGVKRTESLPGEYGEYKHSGYRARNTNGQYGFVNPYLFSKPQ